MPDIKQLIAAYKTVFELPDQEVVINKGEQNEYLVLVAHPIEEEELMEASLMTIGLSNWLKEMNCDPIELNLYITGKYSNEDYEALANSFSVIINDRLSKKQCLQRGVFLENIQLKQFDKMGSLFLRDKNSFSPEYLGKFNPPIHIVDVVPLYNDEARIVSEVGPLLRETIFNQADANWYDAKRSAEDVIKSAVNKVWSLITDWYKQKSMKLYHNLRPGATQEEIVSLEKAINIKLPADYFASLRIYNGEVLFHSYRYLSVEQVKKTWSVMSDLLDKGAFDKQEPPQDDPRKLKNWWSDQWIPFAKDGMGNLICINPGNQSGSSAGIIYWDKDGGGIKTEFSSFLDWLANYSEALYQNKFTVDNEGYLQENF